MIATPRPRFDSLEQEVFLNLWRTYDRLRALEDDLFGQHDRTTFRTIDTINTSLRFGDITHEEQIGSNGAKITARARRVCCLPLTSAST